MVPFGDFSYFIILILVSLPAIMLGIAGKRIANYTPFATMLVLIYTFLPAPGGLILLILFCLFQYLLSTIFLNNPDHNNKQVLKLFLWVILLSILPLICTKIFYSKIHKHIGFIVGISYLTFKSLQMIIEIRDGLIKNITLTQYLNFLLFFPTLSSGPIDRSRRFNNDFVSKLSSQQYKNLLLSGIKKIITGFLYKFIIAFLIKLHVVDILDTGTKGLLNNIAYMYAYSLYLFFDFAGYSLFAIGFSYIFGIKTPENFNMPFISRNIRDFWGRWHMTLSFWFRDFVYMRSVSFWTKSKKIKSISIISAISYITSFGLMGLWHGLNLHYIIYGLYHALLFIIYEYTAKKFKHKSLTKSHLLNKILSIILTLHCVCFGLLIFSGRLF